jgi:hypothetical protein
MKFWLILALGFSALLMYQNCAPGLKTSVLSGGADKGQSSSSGTTHQDLEEDVLAVSESSVENQNICSSANSITLTMKRSSFEEYLCVDRSRLSSRVTPGLMCPGGATISNFPVDSQAVSCQEIKVCGVRYTSKQVYNMLVTLTFDNLPWGCDGKIEVVKPDAEGNLDTIVKTLNLYVKPPECRYCVSSRMQTCGACADPGCTDSLTGAFYLVGDTKSDACPSGQIGTVGVKKCVAPGSWQDLVQKQCSIPKCLFNGTSFDVGSVRTESCASATESRTYSCGPNGQWTSSDNAVCEGPSRPNACIFEGVTYQVGASRTLPCRAGVDGGSFRCETSGQWSRVEIIECRDEITCPSGFISAPVAQTQKRFCVAKYEMKIDNPNHTDPVYNHAFKLTDKPISKARSRPWTNLSRENAIKACQSLGASYDLISSEQWQILAKDIAGQKNNWMVANSKGEYAASGVIAKGQVNQGNSFNTASVSADAATAGAYNYSLMYSASVEDDKYVCGNLKECSSAGAGGVSVNKDFFKKRTHTLSNGMKIWDLAGNANEWIKDDRDGSLAFDTFVWMVNLPSSNIHNYREYSNGELLACAHVATPISNRGCGYGLFRTAPSGAEKGVLRGGGALIIERNGVNYSGGGIFSTYVGRALNASSHIGFRCVFKIDQ